MGHPHVVRDTHYKTNVATCTRKAASLVNKLAIQVLFKDGKQKAVGIIPAEWDTNMDNFKSEGSLIMGIPPPADSLEIYRNMKMFWTKNLDKKNEFVNGMACTVEHYNAENQCLQVLTVTNKRLAVHPDTENVEGCGMVTCFPVRAGYAGTIQRIQGTTLVIDTGVDVTRPLLKILKIVHTLRAVRGRVPVIRPFK